MKIVKGVVQSKFVQTPFNVEVPLSEYVWYDEFFLCVYHYIQSSLPCAADVRDMRLLICVPFLDEISEKRRVKSSGSE